MNYDSKGQKKRIQAQFDLNMFRSPYNLKTYDLEKATDVTVEVYFNETEEHKKYLDEVIKNYGLNVIGYERNTK